MNENEANLLKAFSEFVWPEPKPIFYRLYYRDDGTPICYSMEDLPGNYIDVDPETYARGPGNVHVVNGKLKEFRPGITVTKLKPGGPTGTPCSLNDVAIVVAATQPHVKWNLETNEI